MHLKHRFSKLTRSLAKLWLREKLLAKTGRCATTDGQKPKHKPVQVADTTKIFTSAGNPTTYQILGASAAAYDPCSEAVADRNIARDRLFPPRISSVAHAEKEAVSRSGALEEEDALLRTSQTELKSTAPKLDDAVLRSRWRPLVPGQDVYQSDVADWNNMQYRSPMSSAPANVPSPLSFRKHTGIPKACVFGDR